MNVFWVGLKSSIILLSISLAGCFLNAKFEDINATSASDQINNNIISPNITPKVIPDPEGNTVSLQLSKENKITWLTPDANITTFKISYSLTTMPAENCADGDIVSVSALESKLNNLSPDTTYYYRICSNQDNQFSKGVTGTFKTLKYIQRLPAYSNYLNWNDYLVNDGNGYYNASQSVCPGTEVGSNSCINGGIVQKLVIPGVLNCANIKAFDSLGVFKWYCDNTASDTIIYSTELNSFKGLQDLISDYQFKNNYVVVQVNGVNTYSSEPEKWWTNAIEELPDSASGGTVNLSNSGQVSGKIFIANSPKSGGAYSITEGKISIVTKKGVELKKDTNTGTSFFSTSTSGIKFLWFEGRYDGGDLAQAGFSGTSITHSRFHNLEMRRFGDVNLRLSSATNSIISDFNIHHGGTGIDMPSGKGNLIRDGKFFDNNNTGLNRVEKSVIRNIVFSGNQSSVGGVSLIYHPYQSIMMNMTFVNNDMTNDFRTFSGNYALIHNMLGSNSNYRMLYAWNSAYLTLSQLMSYGTILQTMTVTSTTGAHKFTNNLVLQNGTQCAITNNTANSPGLVNGTCANHGALSNATFTAVVADQTKFFVGKQSVDDAQNIFDNLGLAAFSSILDWVNFDNFYRSWGLDGGAFPSSNNKGMCSSGNCRIWDYRLKADANNLAYNSTNLVTSKNDPFVSGATCPEAVHGNKATTYANNVPITYTFLTNAMETLGDGLGNENSLCESGESCLYTPNFGAYQGEGDYYSQGTCNFQDGTITGVKLYAYPIIGI